MAWTPHFLHSRVHVIASCDFHAARQAFLGTLLAIALAGGVLALLLLVVQTNLIEMLDALSTDVIAKMKARPS